MKLLLPFPFFVAVAAAAAILFSLVGPAMGDEPRLKALIIDGQNNHTVWPKSTVMMKDYLEASGRFEVDVYRTAKTWRGEEHLQTYSLPCCEHTEPVEEPVTDPNFNPAFSHYDVVISNFGWKAASWPQATKDSLEAYVSQGGGLVVVHAASNSFPEWPEYNRMIGLGGWGGRDERSGPYVYFNDKGEKVRDTSPGRGGSHGPQHEFVVEARKPSHPILRGLPERWMHAKDELYDRLRGPAENMTILATAYSSPEFKGTGRHEPVLMTIDYGQGRVFHTTLGHADYSFEGVGFIVTFLRGTEWAATGEVTLDDVPEDFPTAEASSSRTWSWQP